MMPPITWTLEGELCKLARVSNIDEALLSLSLISQEDAWFKLSTLQDWRRGGAETFTYMFEIRTERQAKRYVMKACVVFGAGPLDVVVGEWVRRRRLLHGLGVVTPRLYVAASAVLIEDFVPLSIHEALQTARSEDRAKLLYALGHTAAVLHKAGFEPLSMHDCRSDGTNVVLVDFGEDLGSESGQNPPFGEDRHTELPTWIKSLTTNLPIEDLRTVDVGFVSSLA
jgi:hypothetical protein